MLIMNMNNSSHLLHGKKLEHMLFKFSDFVLISDSILISYTVTIADSIVAQLMSTENKHLSIACECLHMQ